MFFWPVSTIGVNFVIKMGALSAGAKSITMHTRLLAHFQKKK
jgi:hypothetical protein